MFYIAIDSLFLTLVKGLSPAEIAFLPTIATLVCIFIQAPLLKMVEKLGNTKSTRFGTFLLLVSAIFITFGNSYPIILLGRIIYEIAWIFKNMEAIILKNNLIVEGTEEDFIKERNKATTMYSIFTAIIAFVAGSLFNYNNYLPMYLCITTCIICFILSFLIKDVSINDKLEKTKNRTKNNKFAKEILIMFVLYGISYALIQNGQLNGKVFIQNELFKNFSENLTVTYLCLIVAISRIMRIASNIAFGKLYYKLKDKVGVLLITLLGLSFVFLCIGFYINVALILKFAIMSIGFFIILAVRDPVKLYFQDLVLKHTEANKQQSALTWLHFSRKLGICSLGLIISATLLKIEMIYVILGMACIGIIEILLMIKFFSLFKDRQIEKEEIKV
jgi:uncharacterized membrane protein